MSSTSWRYFTTTGGIRPPLKLVGEIAADDIRHRNTFVRARHDADGRLVQFERLAQGEVVLTHRYAYGADGALSRAEIEDADGEVQVVTTPA